MKNIHVIQTDKPSRLSIKDGVLILHRLQWRKDTQHIYITSDEKIKEGEYGFIGNVVGKIYNKKFYKKIILTTDQDLIKDGIQAIPDEFLEWFVKNPSCEFVHFKQKQHFEADKSKRINPLNGVYYTYEIIIPSEEPTFVDKLKEYFENTSEEKIQKDWDETCEKTKGINSPTVEEFLEAQKQNLIDMMQDDEKLGLYDEPKQETLEEAELTKFALSEAKKWVGEDNHHKIATYATAISVGAKWQQQQNKNLYSDEEVNDLLEMLKRSIAEINHLKYTYKDKGHCVKYLSDCEIIIEQFKKK